MTSSKESTAITSTLSMYLSSSNTSCMFERGTITVLIPEPAAASIFAVNSHLLEELHL